MGKPKKTPMKVHTQLPRLCCLTPISPPAQFNLPPSESGAVRPGRSGPCTAPGQGQTGTLGPTDSNPSFSPQMQLEWSYLDVPNIKADITVPARLPGVPWPIPAPSALLLPGQGGHLGTGKGTLGKQRCPVPLGRDQLLWGSSSRARPRGEAVLEA